MTRRALFATATIWVATVGYTLHVLRDLAEHEDIDE